MKLLFIVGTGRCGSTMVHEALARHEDMGFVSNIEDNMPWLNRLGRWNNMVYRSPLGHFTKKGSPRFAPSEAYRLISREVSPIYANSCRDLTGEDVTPWLRKRFERFFLDRASTQQKAVFSHKYTGWPRLGFFSEIFPEARFVHVVRDGRAVANSWLQMPWWGGYWGPECWLWGQLSAPHQGEWERAGRSYVRLAAIAWKILMTAFEESEATLNPDHYLRIRYEDVLDDPRAAFEQVLDLCGLDWTAGFDQHFSSTRFDGARNRAFEEELEPKQIAELEDSLGDILRRYGYL